MTQEEIDKLLEGGSDLLNEAAEQNAESTILHAEFQELSAVSQGGHSSGDPRMSLLYDLQLTVSIELGRTNMLIRDILRLGRGSVIEFDKLVSEPVDVLVNGKKVAGGEVVVIDKHFGIRITSLVDPNDRLRNLKR